MIPDDTDLMTFLLVPCGCARIIRAYGGSEVSIKVSIVRIRGIRVSCSGFTA